MMTPEREAEIRRRLTPDTLRLTLRADDIRDLLAKLDRVREQSQQYERALSNHLCEFDMADWVACGGGHSEHCKVCSESDKGQHRHALLERAERAEAALREARGLPMKWRAEGAAKDTFHATMGIGWKVCADDLDAALAGSEPAPAEKE